LQNLERCKNCIAGMEIEKIQNNVILTTYITVLTTLSPELYFDHTWIHTFLTSAMNRDAWSIL